MALRLLWIGIAVVVLGIAIVGALVGFGAVRQLSPSTPLLPPQIIDRIATAGVWLPAIAAGTGLIVVWVGWCILRAELRRWPPATASDVILTHPEGHVQRGSTRLRGRAVVHGLERAVLRLGGVEGVRIVPTPSSGVRFSLHLELAADADLLRTREHVQRELECVEATTGTPIRPAEVVIRLAATRTRRRVA